MLQHKKNKVEHFVKKNLLNRDAGGRRRTQEDVGGRRWTQVDELKKKIIGHEWKWMRVDAAGRKWMQVDADGWILLKVDENICGATCISDTLIIWSVPICNVFLWQNYFHFNQVFCFTPNGYAHLCTIRYFLTNSFADVVKLCRFVKMVWVALFCKYALLHRLLSHLTDWLTPTWASPCKILSRESAKVQITFCTPFKLAKP